MATPNERLANSLNVLRELQQSGRRVFQSSEIGRVHRERLLKNGFLQEAVRGWLISSSPSAREGDTTPWYASFWEFCARYCDARFGTAWCLSAEQSVMLHAANTVTPSQVVVMAPNGSNNNLALPFRTSLYDFKQPQMPSPAEIQIRDGLRVLTRAAALVRVSETFMMRNPLETRLLLAGIEDASELLRLLLAGGHSTVAGRLAGGLRRAGQPAAALEILKTMKAAGYDVRETDPFAGRQIVAPLAAAPPIVGRIRALWAAMRGQVLEIFPPPPGLPADTEAYLRSVDEIYQSDAYHSLSIEGYQVSTALVERVRTGSWDPENHDADRQSRDSLAARGYWQAFQAVKGTIEQVIRGENAGALVRAAHRDWYRELFQPCVSAGLLAPAALAGYRNDAVYLRTSRYVPPRWEAVRDAMPALFDLLESEPEPAVRVVLGHWLFGYIHPYPDGNGRIARFLMNTMLASGGYPWMVIRVEDRSVYLAALDRASVDADIGAFAEFLSSRAGNHAFQA
jgi:fido (protein-threonine AMPylation protein)